ncbi:MAG: hypothetical protein AAF791_01940 [Bacteroidota bacterium]
MDRFSRSRLARVTGLLTVIATGAVTAPADAQGSFQTLDPFYGGESARQTFFDGLAVSGEVTYRDRDLLGLSEPGAPASDMVLAARLDYSLLPQVDVSAVADLTGAAQQGPLGLSWIVVKPYWRNQSTDYAIRVAVDPASEGGLGFRQTDVAFLSSTVLSPEVTSDFAVGLRRVQTGYVEAEEAATALREIGVLPVSPEGGDSVPLPGVALLKASGDRVRLNGQEIRGTWGYNVLFDPAGSRVHGSLIAEVGTYTLARTGETATTTTDAATERIRSGIGWARLGVEFNRPSYVLAPYVSVPVVTWADVRGDPVRYGPRPDKARFGLRLMLR